MQFSQAEHKSNKVFRHALQSMPITITEDDDDDNDDGYEISDNAWRPKTVDEVELLHILIDA